MYFCLMEYDKYNNVSISSDVLSFKFVSSGTKGDMEKIIKFSPFINDERIYNLALCTIDQHGNEDYETESKNGDRNKILGTIGSAAYTFSKINPDKLIYLKGNTPAKTRLYRMAISTAHDEISKTFHIYGLNEDNSQLVPTLFLKDQDYLAFLFKRKEIDDEATD